VGRCSNWPVFSSALPGERFPQLIFSFPRQGERFFCLIFSSALPEKSFFWQGGRKNKAVEGGKYPARFRGEG